MPVGDSFNDVMARLRAGDEEAAARVFCRFRHRLIGLARSRLDSLIRRKTDPEDILQSVFRSFFRRVGDNDWGPEGWDSLWSLLAVMTIRKCSRRAHYFRAARRDARREASAVDDKGRLCWETLARDPTPREALVLAETVELLLSALGERDRTIVSLRLQGYQSLEIAAHVGCTQRTVQRVLERAAKRLRQTDVGS
jgi:RNA polymerase sigma-70 factor (ECF subfamily)